MPSIYLSGPITGFTYEEAKSWRDEIAKALPQIDCFSPLRGKDYLIEKGVIKAGTTFKEVLSTDQGITGRDMLDTKRSDLLFVNVLGTTQVSIGTIMEIAWAQAMHKPIVIAIEKEGNPHDYPMIREACNWRVDNLPDAINIMKHILMP